MRRCSINGSPVQPDKRADVGIGPYKVQYMTIVGRVFRK